MIELLDDLRRLISIKLIGLALRVRPYKSNSDVDFQFFATDVVQTELYHLEGDGTRQCRMFDYE